MTADADLMQAIEGGSGAGMRAALAAGANPNGAENNGAPLIALSKRPGLESLLEELLAAKADPNLTDEKGMTAFMYVCVRQSVVAGRLLIAHGADVTLEASDGRSAEFILDMIERSPESGDSNIGKIRELICAAPEIRAEQLEKERKAQQQRELEASAERLRRLYGRKLPQAGWI